MKILRPGDAGDDVEHWQNFLIGQGFDVGVADGQFGKRTKDATIAFQGAHGLGADGIVGQGTLGEAMKLGLEVVPDHADPTDTSSANFPDRPAFPPLTTTEDRQRVFGAFGYEAAPSTANPEAIRITDGWATENIVMVSLPFPAGVSGAPASKQVAFHRLAAPQLTKLWAAWGDAGLLDRVLTWDGSYAPRFIRGKTVLSNHAFGTAFDINARYNALGAQPALSGQKGSVRDMVAIANEHGFYWGGHFRTRPDGMHFEVARLLDAS